MGNATCCSKKDEDKAQMSAAEIKDTEAIQVLDSAGISQKSPDRATALVSAVGSFPVVIDKSNGQKLGLDVDYMAERKVLPIIMVTGDLAQRWNDENPNNAISKGDAIINVNGTTSDVAAMLQLCKSQPVLNLVIARAMSFDDLVADLAAVVKSGPACQSLLRLSWRDGTASLARRDGAPNAAPNAAFLFEPSQADSLAVLKPVMDKYCPDLISHADLLVLAANMAIKAMGGPDLVTRYGRVDAQKAQANPGVESKLREDFSKAGFNDKAYVALSAASAMGQTFTNTYFKEVISEGSGEFMQDATLRKYVELYATSEVNFVKDFSKEWIRLQEGGCDSLRELL